VTEQSLDDIMSGRDEPVSDQITTEPATAQPDADPGHSRDDKGRFASKAEQVATPEAVEHPTQQPGHVPIQALDAERGKRKELEDRYEREMREMREQLTRLSQPPKPEEPPAPPPNMFEDPDGYVRHQLQPIEQRLAKQAADFSMRMAVKEHGKETWDAAEQALMEAVNTPEGQQVVAMLRSSDDPAEELIQWHKRRSVVSEIGTDPEAYFQRRLAEWQASQSQPQSQQPTAQPVMPSTFSKAPSGGPRGGADYGGPRPLSEIMNGR
jgi:hypothetical protein